MTYVFEPRTGGGGGGGGGGCGGHGGGDRGVMKVVLIGLVFLFASLHSSVILFVDLVV